MRFDDLEAMTADEIRQVNLWHLLRRESCFIVRTARSAISSSCHRYDLLDDADIVHTCIVDMFPRGQSVLDYVADVESGHRASSIARYVQRVIRTQWPRIFHRRLCRVGEPDLAEFVEDGISLVVDTTDPSLMNACTPSVEDTLMIANELDERVNTLEEQIETVRAHLQPAQYEVLRAYLVDGLTKLQIASIRGCKINNIHSILRSARARMEELLA